MLRRELIPPLFLLLVPLCLLLGLSLGSQSWSWLWQSDTGQTVLWHIRLPRVLMAFLLGAVLAWAGVLIQGVVRNPLADPGIIGVAGGAAVGAALFLALLPAASAELQTLFAFAGAWLALWLVLKLGLSGSAMHAMSFLILAGIAVNVMASALIGLLSYLASDSSLRQITFWLLGSLGNANWYWVSALAAILLAALCYWPQRLRQLDALLLGDTEARSMGIEVAQLQQRTVVWVALMVSVAVSASGIIGFIGLVSPHIARLLTGASHRRVLPLAVLIGGCLMVLADTLARLLIAPAELPIGIVTSLLGAPVFIALLLREKRRLSW